MIRHGEPHLPGSKIAGRLPGEELMGEVQSRMVAGLLRLTERHPDETVAVISHGEPSRAALDTRARTT